MKEQRSDYGYALHDALTGKDTEVARRKRWWMRRILGPNGRKYSRMLFNLPPLGDEQCPDHSNPAN